MVRRLVTVAHGFVGKRVARRMKQLGLDEDRGAVEISSEFIHRFFGDITEEENESPVEWTFEFSECPYGFREGRHSMMCRAAMKFEERVVEGLGGRLIIEERIPDGAARCRFRVLDISY